MATPHVSGLAALLIGLDSSLTNADVESLILSTSANNVEIDIVTGLPILEAPS